MVECVRLGREGVLRPRRTSESSSVGTRSGDGMPGSGRAQVAVRLLPLGPPLGTFPWDLPSAPPLGTFPWTFPWDLPLGPWDLGTSPWVLPLGLPLGTSPWGVAPCAHDARSACRSPCSARPLAPRAPLIAHLDPSKVIDDPLPNRERFLRQPGSHRVAARARSPFRLEARPVCEAPRGSQT